MELIVKHLDNVKFAVLARGHEIVCDQPLDNGRHVTLACRLRNFFWPRSALALVSTQRSIYARDRCPPTDWRFAFRRKRRSDRRAWRHLKSRSPFPKLRNVTKKGFCER